MREPAFPPEIRTHAKGQLVFPHDPKGKGTWIAASSFGKVACLLNGAWEKHISEPTYRLSRGLVLLALFDYANAQEFAKEYMFEGVEPFTLVVAEQQSLLQIRWDGSETDLQVLDYTKAHIWSSVTLYEAEVIAAREKFFHAYLTQLTSEPKEAMLTFHRFNGKEDFPLSIEMKAGGQTQTVSISQLEVGPQSIGFTYLDTLTQEQSFAELQTQPMLSTFQ